MVRKRVEEARTSEWEKAVGRALGELDRISLHHIRSEKAIETICREVISRVDGTARLVRITPELLEQLRESVRKKVRKNLLPIPSTQLSEVEIIRQSAKIREDWSSAKWKADPPHGWAWKEEVIGKRKKDKPKKEIVALVYETRSNPGDQEIFLDTEILAHPQGALALIKNMNKRHAALMTWKKGK